MRQPMPERFVVKVREGVRIGGSYRVHKGFIKGS